MNKHYLHRCLVLALASTTVVSQTNAQTSNENQTVTAYGQRTPLKLQPITIMGNKINDIDNTLFNVDILNLNVLRNPGVNDLRGALNFNPAVEINTSGSGKADQLRIRGFGENYTELTLDGQKMPEYFAFGPYVSGGKGFVDSETLKQIDIIKGLHSPKQSSGALAGSVNMQTYDPSDFVDATHPFYGSLKAGYSSKNNGISATAGIAAAQNNLSGLIIYTRRQAHEFDNMGDDINQTRNDIQDIEQNNVLVKGELGMENGRVLITGEYFKNESETTPRYKAKKSSDIEPTTRARLKAEGEFTRLWGMDEVKVQASTNHYKQQTANWGTSNFEQNNFNLEFDGVKVLEFGDMQHQVLFGAAYDNDTFDYTLLGRKGVERYIPEISRDTFTLYGKDQLQLNNGLTISPGFQIAHQRISSEVDEAYNTNPAVSAQGSYTPNGSTTVITPSINAVMPLSDASQLFASYARGSHMADSSNLGSFDHGFAYFVPNPNLKNESSDNYELGFNFAIPQQAEFKATAFYTKYRDFIGFEQDGFFGTNKKGAPKPLFRKFNVDEAKTYGAELEGGYALSPEFYAHAAVAWMRGRIGNQASHGVTLSQAYPLKAVLGLRYDRNDRWGGNVNWTLAGKGQEPEKPESHFQTPGYGVVDMTGWWKPMEGFTLTAGVYNVLDKKYWHSGDANGLTTVTRSGKSVNMDSYTQPGRNFALNLRYEF